MHIGLIGGIGPAATAFYYERIVRAFDTAGNQLHLTIAHTSARILTRNNAAGNVQPQAEEYLRVTKQLAAAGADVVVITSMGGHFCVEEFAALSPLPLIRGPEAVAEHFAAAGIRKIGILGTRIVMETALYGALGEFGPTIPTGDALQQVHDDYVAVAVAGEALPDPARRLLDAGRQLIDQQGADAVLLGGTDLNLVYDGMDEFPVIDSAAIHADAVARYALAHA